MVQSNSDDGSSMERHSLNGCVQWRVSSGEYSLNIHWMPIGCPLDALNGHTVHRLYS